MNFDSQKSINFPVNQVKRINLMLYLSFVGDFSTHEKMLVLQLAQQKSDKAVSTDIIYSKMNFITGIYSQTKPRYNIRVLLIYTPTFKSNMKYRIKNEKFVDYLQSLIYQCLANANFSRKHVFVLCFAVYHIQFLVVDSEQTTQKRKCL